MIEYWVCTSFNTMVYPTQCYRDLKYFVYFSEILLKSTHRYDKRTRKLRQNHFHVISYSIIFIYLGRHYFEVRICSYVIVSMQRYLACIYTCSHCGPVQSSWTSGYPSLSESSPHTVPFPVYVGLVH